MALLSSQCSNSRRSLKVVSLWVVSVGLSGKSAWTVDGAALGSQVVVSLPLTKACSVTALPLTGTVVQVSTEAQLQSAMHNLQPGTTILIANGTYILSNTLNVNNVNDATIRGASGC